MLEHRDERRGDELPLFLVVCFEDIEADRIFGIRRVKIDNLVRPSAWDEAEDVLNEFSVRVYDTHTVPLPDVPYRHIFEEC